MIDPQHRWNTSFFPVILGFALSFTLLLLAFFLSLFFTQSIQLQIGILGLALIQTGIQIVLFFHIGHESSPRWNLITLLFTMLILSVIIGGSHWIMYSLNYTLMPAPS